MKHGGSFTSFNDPTAVNFGGFFGKMFPHLPAFDPVGATDEAKIDALKALADRFFVGTDNPDNETIPAAYTYFGQFVDHDITLDTISRLDRPSNPRDIQNFRTPRLELDSVYGGGPEASPYLYDGIRLIVGQVATTNEPDLQRNLGGNQRAIIGDPRNDENFIVAQLHLAFIKFHNKVVEELEHNYPGFSEKRIFEEARRIVTWHYQWVVLYDLVKRLSLPAVFRQKDPNEGGVLPGFVEVFLKYIDLKEKLFMPVEFSVAVFRLGHSMVRPAYVINDVIGTEVPIFSTTPGTSDLRGFRPLEAQHTIQWNKFLDFGTTPQFSKKLDTHLSAPLSDLPDTIVADFIKNLAARNLIRSYRLQLPSGQDIARVMGEDPILSDQSPLWFYILSEAMDHSGGPGEPGGQRLGRVGSEILTEVFWAMMASDPTSYLNVHRNWTPSGETVLQIHTGSDPFELKHIIEYAEMPITEADVRTYL